ncbi:hypothetical protein [Promicromonospora sp. NPDC023987]|uniref:nSTAND1 domain-containing NTPase n=1 Tax=Promicromonospora sp. NPDC023987 TaxID=3155360 RepID=UPI0033EDBAFF
MNDALVAPLASSLIRVREPGPTGATVGRAVLVAADLAVATWSAEQGPAPDHPIMLEPVTGARGQTAADVVGRAVASDGATELALLRLTEPITGAAPVPLIEAGDLWGRHVQALGFPVGYDDGVLARALVRAADASGRVQLDPVAGEYRLGEGFAGAAAWDAAGGGVVGVLSVRGTTLIPTRAVLDALARVCDEEGLGVDLAAVVRPRTPFPGLAAFEESDRAHFHGRESESADLFERIRDQRRVSVVGPSGAGKSSLVLAGLVPRVRARGDDVSVIRGSGHGARPVDDVLRLLDGTDERRAGGRRGDHLVVLDQVEEILATPGGDDALARLCSDDVPAGLRVVLTLRPDTYARLQADDRLSRLTSGPLLLSPPDTGALGDMLDAASAHPGVQVEAGLVRRILTDLAPVAAPLPLLSYVVNQLWSSCWAESRANGTPFTLTVAAYYALGGATGAIDQRAGQVWEGLAAREQQGRQLLLRLVSKDDRDADAVRRTLPVADLPPGQRDVAHRLASEGLLVIGAVAGTEQPVVSLVHETVTRQWGLLADLIEQHASFLIWRTGLERDAARWAAQGRDVERAPGREALDEADGKLDAFPDSTDQDFLDRHARDYLAAGRRRRRRRARTRALAATGLAMVTAVAAVFATSAVVGWANAREAQVIADSHSLVRESQNLALTDPSLSAMTALAAYATEPTRESRNQLLRTYVRHAEDARIVSAPAPLSAGAVVASADGEVFLRRSRYSIDIVTRAVSGPATRHTIVTEKRTKHVVLAEDGSRAVVFYQDGGAARFDIEQSASDALGELHDLAPAGVPETAEADQEVIDSELFDGSTMESLWGWSVNVDPTISPDGRYVAARVWDRVVVWDLVTGSVIHKTPVVPGMTWDLWFAGDQAERLVTRVKEEAGDDLSRLVALNVTTGKTWDVSPTVNDVAVSTTGSMIVTCRADGEEHVIFETFRTSDGKPVGDPLRRAAAFQCSSPLIDSAGRYLYHAPELIDLKTGKTLSSPDLDVAGDRLFENGGVLYGTGRSDGGYVYREVPWSGEDGAAASASTLSADGSRLYVVQDDGRMVSRSLDPEDDATTPPLASRHRLEPYWEFQGADKLRENRAGTVVLERAGLDVVAVRDADTLAVLTTIEAHEPKVSELEVGLGSLLGGVADPGPRVIEPATSDFSYHFSGEDVMTRSDLIVQLWDAATGAELAELDLTRFIPEGDRSGPDATVSAGPGPDAGTIAVTVFDHQGVMIVDIRSGQVLETLDLPADTIAVQFDPSGKYLGVLRSGAILELWRTDPLRRVIGPLPSLVEDASVPFVARFTDDEGVFILGTGNQLGVYDIEEGALTDSYSLTSPAADEGRGAFLDVSADLSQMIYLTPDLTGAVTPLDPTLWQDHLCEALAGRDLTDAEIESLPGDLHRGLICRH